MKQNLITANIILYCKKFEASVRFYRDKLHLPVLFSTGWFVEFCLNDMSRLSVADEKRSSIKSADGRGMTLSLEVKDIEAEWKHLEKNGLQPTVIKEHPWNARVFYLSDPEGRRIEIWQVFRSACDDAQTG